MNKIEKYTAYIWRESIYKDNFSCWCGYKLFDAKKGLPSKDLIEKDGLLTCPKCGLLVGKVMEIEDVKGLPTMGGAWSDYEKRKAN